MSWPPGVESWDSFSVRPVSPTTEVLAAKVTAAIEVARNSLRVFIDAHFFGQASADIAVATAAKRLHGIFREEKPDSTVA